ncbi:MAG: hypothetical protein Q4C42_02270 [Clostridia bacterium]|nr:hypothetical protein [Clostridia bacterium]
MKNPEKELIKKIASEANEYIDNSDLTPESAEPVEYQPEDTRSTDEKIRDAFKTVIPADHLKNRAYYEVKRHVNDKKYMAKAKWTYKKHVFDRYVPALAAVCICFVAYAFYAVSNGWLTGQKYVESTRAAQNEGYVYEGEDETLKAVKEYLGVEEETAAEEEPVLTAAGEAENDEDYVVYDSAESEGLPVYSMTENGKIYTLYEIPEDYFALFDEMKSIGAIPEEVELNTYSVDSADAQNEVLVLDFNDAINNYTDGLKSIADSVFNYQSEYKTIRFTVGETVLEEISK